MSESQVEITNSVQCQKWEKIVSLFKWYTLTQLFA